MCNCVGLAVRLGYACYRTEGVQWQSPAVSQRQWHMPGSRASGSGPDFLAASSSRGLHSGVTPMGSQFSRSVSSFAVMPLLPAQQRQMKDAELVQQLLMRKASAQV